LGVYIKGKVTDIYSIYTTFYHAFCISADKNVSLQYIRMKMAV